jgi:hypothetical protein
MTHTPRNINGNGTESKSIIIVAPSSPLLLAAFGNPERRQGSTPRCVKSPTFLRNDQQVVICARAATRDFQNVPDIPYQTG